MPYRSRRRQPTHSSDLTVSTTILSASVNRHPSKRLSCYGPRPSPCGLSTSVQCGQAGNIFRSESIWFYLRLLPTSYVPPRTSWFLWVSCEPSSVESHELHLNRVQIVQIKEDLIDCERWYIRVCVYSSAHCTILLNWLRSNILINILFDSERIL